MFQTKPSQWTLQGTLVLQTIHDRDANKWGIKGFILSDASKGYVYRFQIHTGKSMENRVECSRVVLQVMKGREDPGLSYTQIITTVHSCF